MESTQGLINWILVVVFTNLAAIGTAILAFVKASKMIPKEVEGAELDNKGKEASVADQFNEIALKAAEQAVVLQDRLLRIEGDYNMLKSAHDELARKVVMQDVTIKEQARTIDTQTIRLNQQGTKLTEQDELIASLRFDLDATTEYNETLIRQLKAKNITPAQSTKRRKTNGRPLDENLTSGSPTE